MDKFDVVFVAVLCLFVAAIGAAVVVDVVASEAVVVVTGEFDREID